MGDPPPPLVRIRRLFLHGLILWFAWNCCREWRGLWGFPGFWRIVWPGHEGGGGYPPVGPAHGGEGTPHLKKRRQGGYGGPPPPPPPSTPPVTPTPVPLLPVRILTAKYRNGSTSSHAKPFALHDPCR